MGLNTLGYTLQTIGHLLIAYTAISVHFRFRKEHRIDDKVFKVMKREQIVGVIGVLLIIVGYIAHII